MTYNLRFLTSLAAVAAAFAIVLPVQANSRIIPMESFQQFLRSTNQTVERKLKREFAVEYDQLERLRNPYKIGDNVNIVIIRGKRKETISGRFNGIISNKYVKISSTHILIDDVEPNDRELLTWNNDQEKLDKLIEEREAALFEDTMKRRKFFLRNIYRDRGYTSPENFYSKHVVIGDKICPKSYLGAGKIVLTVEMKPGEELVTCKLSTRMQRGAQFVVAMNGTGMAHLDDSKSGGSHHFELHRSDLDDDFVPMITDMLEIRCHREGIGTWTLLVRDGSKKRRNKAKFLFVFEDLEEHETRLPEVPRNAQALFTSALKEAQGYQDSVRKVRARLDAEAAAQEAQAEDETPVAAGGSTGSGATNVDSAAVDKMIKSLSTYEWKAARTVAATDKINAKSNLESDNILYPKTLGKDAVLYYSNWQKARLTSKESPLQLDNSRYRLLLTRNQSQQMQLYFQYSGSYTSFSSALQVVSADFKLSGEGGEAAWQNSFELAPNWSGRLFAANKVSKELVAKPIGSMTLSLADAASQGGDNKNVLNIR